MIYLVLLVLLAQVALIMTLGFINTLMIDFGATIILVGWLYFFYRIIGSGVD